MKRNPRLTLLVSVLALPVAALLGQPATAPPDLLIATDPAQTPNYSAIERGPHHRIMASVAWTTNATTGKILARTNAYTELATGMHRLQDGRWVEASTEIELVPGGAIARNGAHTVSFAANLSAAGAIDCTTPDGKRLRSTIIGLSYFDAATGDSVLIAELQDSIGELLPSGNQVLYSDAFTNLQADVLYTYTRAGLEQNIILREQPPSPAEFGLDPTTTRLEVLTEFLDPPTPAITTAFAPGRAALSAQGARITAAADPPLTDETVSFGAMQLRRGRAFMLGAQSNRGVHIAVSKSWQNMGGRTVLVEQVKYPAIEPHLRALPAPAAPRQDGSPGQGALLRLSPHRLLPPVRMAARLTNSMLLARSSTLGKGLVLDYDLSGSQTNFTFRADTTYSVVGPVYLSGLTRIEGGSVIKYPAGDVSIEVVGDGAVECLTAAYRPATFTAADDNSIGTVIAGSTGIPTNYYGGTALDLSAVSCPGITNVSFCYLSNAFAGEGIVLRDAQIIRCYSGFAPPRSVPSLYNVLIYEVNTLVDAEEKELGGDDLTAENVTAHCCTNLMADLTSIIRLTNCLFACVGGWQCVTTLTNNSVFLTSDADVFQTVGAAGHYLAPDSPYRNVGTTNISPDLLAGLRHKTTYPPIVCSNVLLSADTTFAPQAQRDTDIPDLGYHYDPLDYLFKYVRATNSTVRLLPGTAIATAGPYGIGLQAGSQLISEGGPTSLNHIARYNLVQECFTSDWTGKGGSVFGNWLGGLPAAASFRFTDWSMPAKDGSHLYAYWQDMVNSCCDCQFHGGQVQILYPTPHLTNCLLERVDFLIDDDLIGEDVSPIVRNCLFFGGTLTLNHDNSDTWLFRDNLFDQTSIVTNILGSDIDGAYNGYTPNSGRLVPTNAYDIVASINYDTGPLGSYYQPTNSAFIDRGSTTANLVGLYHYTTQTNQVKETNSVVDIGYHYVALDASGAPVDTDGDGVPDYLEDVNGDGNPANDPTSWLFYNSPNGLTGTTPFVIFTPLR